MTERTEHIPPALAVRQLLATATCPGLAALNALALRDGYALDAERIACPVRIVWGTADRLLPWPSAAARYRTEWLPHADWVTLDGVGHSPAARRPRGGRPAHPGHHRADERAHRTWMTTFMPRAAWPGIEQ